MSKQSTKKRLIIAGALTTVLAAGGVAMAGGKNCENGRSDHKQTSERKAMQAEKRLDRLAEKLNLDDEQKTQIQSIMEANRETMQQQREASRAALKTEMSAVLNAEQMEEFEALGEKRRNRHDKDRQAEES